MIDAVKMTMPQTMNADMFFRLVVSMYLSSGFPIRNPVQ